MDYSAIIRCYKGELTDLSACGIGRRNRLRCRAERRSIPERISDSWVALISTDRASGAITGTWNLPGVSSRLYQIAKPSRSQ